MTLLKDKICIITGAAGSLGLASARLFLAEGARVALVDLEAGALAKAAATLAAKPENVMTFAADVADVEATKRYVEATVARFGKIDVLFSNAGISGVIRPIVDYPEDVFDRVMAVNVRASFLALKYGLPKMNDGGSALITASVVGVTSDPGISAYATSKHAVIGLMRTAAKEAAARRIRVNVLAPGPIDNEFQKDIEVNIGKAIGRDATALLNSMIPLHRHGGADEIARSALYLASDLSSFTTGSVLMADGGMHV